MGVGLKIKEHLRSKGITATHYANVIDENRTQVNAYLNEKLKPSIKFIEKTIDYFPEMDLNYLFRDGDTVNESVPIYSKPPAQLVEEIQRKAGEIDAMAQELKKRLTQK